MLSGRLLKKLTGGEELSTLEVVTLITLLSFPAVVSQMSQVVMEYIDASMVGQLGAGGSAAIGIIAPTTWLFGSVMYACVIGFSVQMAQYIGAGNKKKAHDILYEGMVVCLAAAIAASVVGFMISGALPVFLGGDEEIAPLSTGYFRIFSLGAPIMVMEAYLASMLQSSGKLMVSGSVMVISCFMDVVFNCFCIFEKRMINIGSLSFLMPGLGLGVSGAALGTVLSEALALIILIICVIKYNEPWKYGEKAEFSLSDMKKACRIAFPLAIEQTILQGAQVASILIVSPLGTVSIAANSLAVTAEGLCYMPGYGVQQAASTLIGQATGAGRKDLLGKLSFISLFLGMLVMTVMGVLMYILSPFVMGMMTSDQMVRALGTEVLRIEAFAEPLFAAYIVSNGMFRGMGDTITPSMISMSCMWLIRIPLAFFLSGRYGLRGVWTAMALQLCVQGIIFIIRLRVKIRTVTAKEEALS